MPGADRSGATWAPMSCRRPVLPAACRFRRCPGGSCPGALRRRYRREAGVPMDSGFGRLWGHLGLPVAAGPEVGKPAVPAPRVDGDMRCGYPRPVAVGSWVAGSGLGRRDGWGSRRCGKGEKSDTVAIACNAGHSLGWPGGACEAGAVAGRECWSGPAAGGGLCYMGVASSRNE